MAHHIMDTKDCLSDSLLSEKLLTNCYNTAITECASDQLRRDLMSIYQEEQNNLKAVFDTMYNRGWYQLNMASQQDIQQVQNQFRQELQRTGVAGQVQTPNQTQVQPQQNYAFGQTGYSPTGYGYNDPNRNYGSNNQQGSFNQGGFNPQGTYR